MKLKIMSKRINVILPDATVAVLEKVTSKGNRSRLISKAVLHYVKTQSGQNLRERLKQGYLANAVRDLEIATEWFPIEEEAWQKASSKKKQKS
jgi:CopG family transcriptional regulator/antitoxin EndoAI